MIIGVPKEIKTDENRVAITPSGVNAFVSRGHTVLIERSAGVGSGIEDADYERAGATILPEAEEVWQRAEMILKIKEPVEPEIDRMREGQIVFTYLHLAANRELTLAMMERGVVGIAYETIQLP
ncbi:MAG: alanine dehydrogenase, partial [Deltaproteobacteria bacterium]